MLHGLSIISTKVGQTKQAYPYADPQSHPDYAGATERDRLWRVEEIAEQTVAARILDIDGNLTATQNRFTNYIELGWAVTQWMAHDDESDGANASSRMPLFPKYTVSAGKMRVRYVQIGHLHTKTVDLWAIARYMDGGSGHADKIQYLSQAVPFVEWSDTPIARSKTQIARQFIALLDSDKGFCDKQVRIRVSS